MVVARQAVATVGADRVNANRVGSATVTTWPTFCLALINIWALFTAFIGDGELLGWWA